MFNNTTFSPRQNVSTPCNSVENNSRENESYFNKVLFSTSIVTAVLSPVAVAGNGLILAAIWKKTFARTPFHILLSGLAFTDLCTGLIAQPFYVATALMYIANHGVQCNMSLIHSILNTTGQSSSIYLISLTVLLITLMSIERWLHMSSRRSLVTSRRGYFTVILLLLLPIPCLVFRVLANSKQTYKYHMRVTLMASIVSCYFTTSFAYFKVYRIIRRHQQQVQAGEPSQNFGQPAIDLAKYKKSVTSMLYILLLFSVSVLPYIVTSVVYVSLSQKRLGVAYAALQASVVFLFLSSSLNPGLYLWRMSDIRNGVRQLLCSGNQ
ncbi:hypothetical protein ACROYT_G035859 [Oculina patagonica]